MEGGNWDDISLQRKQSLKRNYSGDERDQAREAL